MNSKQKELFVRWDSLPEPFKDMKCFVQNDFQRMEEDELYTTNVEGYMDILEEIVGSFKQKLTIYNNALKEAEELYGETVKFFNDMIRNYKEGDNKY